MLDVDAPPHVLLEQVAKLDLAGCTVREYDDLAVVSGFAGAVPGAARIGVWHPVSSGLQASADWVPDTHEPLLIVARHPAMRRVRRPRQGCQARGRATYPRGPQAPVDAWSPAR